MSFMVGLTSVFFGGLAAVTAPRMTYKARTVAAIAITPALVIAMFGLIASFGPHGQRQWQVAFATMTLACIVALGRLHFLRVPVTRETTRRAGDKEAAAASRDS